MDPAPVTGFVDLVPALARAGIQCSTAAATVAQYSRDWTGRWIGPVLGVVRPQSTEQVVSILRLAGLHGVPVHVQGGNTGLVGGSIPIHPSLLLVTTGLKSIGSIDPLERTVIVGAGVTCAELAQRARAAGLHFGVDLAARDSATVGGMAATNAGGLGVIAFGMMRQHVRGIVAVHPTGAVLDTTLRPRKDNAGFDLTGLLVGSEGTLGVITAVEVALHPAHPHESVGALAVPDLATAAAAARAVQAGGTRLLAAEVVDRQGVRRAAQLAQVADPLAAGGEWLLLLQVADGGTGAGLASVAEAVTAVATDARDRAKLWALRERQAEIYAGAAPVKLDVSVRVSALDELVERIRGMLGGAGEAGFFGHVLDGNLHVQLTGVPPRVGTAVLELVAALGGSISAEHGIGRMKPDQLHLVRTPAEIAWMRAIKRAVDPSGLVNAGVLLPP